MENSNNILLPLDTEQTLKRQRIVGQLLIAIPPVIFAFLVYGNEYFDHRIPELFYDIVNLGLPILGMLVGVYLMKVRYFHSRLLGSIALLVALVLIAVLLDEITRATVTASHGENWWCRGTDGQNIADCGFYVTLKPRFEEFRFMYMFHGVSIVIGLVFSYILSIFWKLFKKFTRKKI